MQCGCAGSSLSGNQSLTGDHAYARPIASADPTDPDQNGTRTVGQTVSHYNNGHGSESITVNAKPHHPAPGLNFNYGITASDVGLGLLYGGSNLPSGFGAAFGTGLAAKQYMDGDKKEALISLGLAGATLVDGANPKLLSVLSQLRKIKDAATAAKEEKAAGSVLQNAAHESGGTSKGGSASSGRQKWTTDQAAGSLIENAGEKSTATFDAEAFEKSLSNLSASERVAIVKNQAKNIAQEYGWKKDNKLSRINNRDIYQTEDGEIYSVDTQHGRLEKINPRNGNHLGEFNFNLDPTGKIDRSGGHDIKVR